MPAPTLLEVKVALLYHGLQIPPKLIAQLNREDPNWQWGRKGGAGPAGGRYFLITTPKAEPLPVVNVPLQSKFAQFSPLKVQNIRGVTWEIVQDGDSFCELQLLPVPTFHGTSLDGRPAGHYALLHGTNCLASTVNQRCTYWTAGQQCQFCGIELSLEAGSTVEVKDAGHLLQVLELALEESPVTHVTLTTGTQPDASRGIREYLPIVQEIKASHPEITIHAQFEPPRQDYYTSELKEAGCDTVGIHVEILDDARRKATCPGKGHLRWVDYTHAWEFAVETFGKNQVDSYILLGLEPFDSPFFDRVQEMCAIGVVPYPVPAREIPGTGFEAPIADLETLVEAHRRIAKIMQEEGVDPQATIAGCVRCTACSAILEAIQK
ncbi:MAG TPA: radical SAM protein [Candidatus Lokiarchaeia archaeon]|nr:radical SAM protein [Candidatus Lokiarchaeia archaeon]